jgi:phage major head subunit gpT-like protein
VSTGAGSALGIGGLSVARLALRVQTGIDGRTILDIPPVFLVVCAALETTAQQLLVATNYAPTELGDVNPFPGKLELVVDPRLDAVSTTA